MLEKLPRYPFTQPFIDSAPDDPGIYVLWLHGAMVYVGRADGGELTVKKRLQQHFSGELCACSRRATHYTWEIASHPALLERTLLRQHVSSFGELPSCNRHAA